MEEIEKKTFPLWLWEFPSVFIQNHCNKLECGRRWILISCKSTSSFGFTEVARVHIRWGHCLSLADLMARADPLAQQVKEPLSMAAVGELPCPVFPFGHKLQKGMSVPFPSDIRKSDKDYVQQNFTLQTRVSWLITLMSYTCDLVQTYTVCTQTAFKCFRLLIYSSSNKMLSILVAFSCHSAASCWVWISVKTWSSGGLKLLEELVGISWWMTCHDIVIGDNSSHTAYCQCQCNGQQWWGWGVSLGEVWA